MISSSIHLPENNIISFFFMAENSPLLMVSYCLSPFLTPFLVVGHLGGFQIVVIMSTVAINMGMQVALLCSGLHSFGYIPRRGIAIIW
jgi:hypothetical protein